MPTGIAHIEYVLVAVDELTRFGFVFPVRKKCCVMRQCRCGYQCTCYSLMHGRLNVCLCILSRGRDMLSAPPSTSGDSDLRCLDDCV